ncbi:MAG: CHAT domain-containing tetratricopeptide repeat protein [Planctomycetota bacterium]|jgi:tetratricopeptide (TPR) repeat protein
MVPKHLLLSLCLVCALCGGARAEDETFGDQHPELTAALIKAHHDGEQAHFEDLVEQVTENAWTYADRLLRRGEPDVARAFAMAISGADTARLPEYLRSRRSRPHDVDVREALYVSSTRGTPEEASASLAALDAVVGRGDAFERALVELERGALLKILGRHAEAAEAYMSAGRAAERLGWLSLAAQTYRESGFSASHDLNYEGMLGAWTRLITVEQGRGLPAYAGQAIILVASTHAQLGDYATAHRYFEESEAACVEGEWPGGIAWALQNRSVVYVREGRYAEAQSALERALTLVDREDDRLGYADLKSGLGSVLLDVKQLDRALECFEEAQRIFVAEGDPKRIAEVIGNIGLVYIGWEEYDEALARMERAREMFVEQGDAVGHAGTLINLGWIHILRREPAEAVPYLVEAVELAEDTDDAHTEALARDNLADAYRLLGQHEEAIELHEDVLRLGTRLESSYVLMRGHLGLAEDWLASGKPDRAFRAAERAMEYSLPMVSGLAHEQASASRERLSQLYSVGARAALAWNNAAALFRALESARAGALLESLENREEIARASIPPALLEGRQQASRTVGMARAAYQQALEGGVLREIRQAKTALESAREQLHLVIGQIQRAAKAAASVLYPVAANLEDVQDTLPDGAVFVTYALVAEKAVALVVTPHAARIVDLGDAEPIEEAARVPLNDLEGNADDALERLRALVIGPLGLTSRHEQVLVSPDGILGFVPFGALIRDRQVICLPSATAYRVLLDEGGEGGTDVLALGDPDYRTALDPDEAVAQRGGIRLSPLPATRVEVESVGDVVLLGEGATPSALHEALAKRPRWRAVHFACHGLVDSERPLRSALALSFEEDGSNLLTCADVMQSRIDADLAVLSACETGRGKIYRSEGIVGFTQAFMLAGAPRVLCSLWKVDDEATRALMVKFYELWNPEDGSEGHEAAEALRRAQEYVRTHPDHPAWAHPYYWAAWVLWGLP